VQAQLQEHQLQQWRLDCLQCLRDSRKCFFCPHSAPLPSQSADDYPRNYLIIQALAAVDSARCGPISTDDAPPAALQQLRREGASDSNSIVLAQEPEASPSEAAAEASTSVLMSRVLPGEAPDPTAPSAVEVDVSDLELARIEHAWGLFSLPKVSAHQVERRTGQQQDAFQTYLGNAAPGTLEIVATRRVCFDIALSIACYRCAGSTPTRRKLAVRLST
jgi:hypothetical protein